MNQKPDGLAPHLAGVVAAIDPATASFQPT